MCLNRNLCVSYCLWMNPSDSSEEICVSLCVNVYVDVCIRTQYEWEFSMPVIDTDIHRDVDI